jgi:hypothetical protein
MISCEKCWEDSKALMRSGFYEDHYSAYKALMREREAAGKICSPKEQAGMFWDEEKQIDKRSKEYTKEIIYPELRIEDPPLSYPNITKFPMAVTIDEWGLKSLNYFLEKEFAGQIITISVKKEKK